MGDFLAYAGARGHTLLDRELYLTEDWTKDGARLRSVGQAPDTPFATKPQLARHMLERVCDAEVPMAWGHREHSPWSLPRPPQLAGGLEAAPYAGGAAQREAVVCTDFWGVDEVHAVHREREWHRISTGTGSKEECWCDCQC